MSEQTATRRAPARQAPARQAASQHGTARDDGAPDVVCLGETMVLLTPTTGAGPAALRTAELASLHVGGAESNLAMNLAALGVPAAWAGRVGADPLGAKITDVVGGHGVDVSLVEVDPHHPTAVYFKDPGVERSPVYYYRAGSAAAAMTPAYLDRLPLERLRLLHLSGITPGLSATCRDTVAAAIDRMAAQPGLVSFDVNYRAGVWPVRTAAPVIAELAARCDLLFVGRDEAEVLWGTRTADDIRGLFPDVQHLIVKDAEVGATDFTGTQRTFVATPPVEVVEPVGAGDAFGAGYLSALLEGRPADERLARGHRVAAVALSHLGDVAAPHLIAAAR